MQLMIEATREGIMLGSELCQIWKGTTETGCDVMVYVRGVSPLRLKDKEWLLDDLKHEPEIDTVYTTKPLAIEQLQEGP